MNTRFSALGLAPEEAWRKSSYSDGVPSNCVEVADLSTWFKSSYSGGTGNNCLEVADLTHQPSASRNGGVGIRDSKNPGGPALLLGLPAWRAFLAGVATSAG
ncbi:DUF397 domain-containing protein [Streptomyces sp. NRRL B-1347]|uniref:DUF397 domain-containing protein n=1 Tax=Streptomyces sp. NRRL B-1347 TaxID=1476877 RepID=UPI0004CAFF3F|nr:DUF397 domain-containing protein [Streptomyces sp. NRRL B-1347]